MSKIIIGICASFLLLVIVQSNAAFPRPDSKRDTSEVRSQLTLVNKRYSDAFTRGDSLLFMDCYAANACIMAPNAPIIKDNKGLISFFKLGYSGGVRRVTFTTIALFGLTDEFVTEQGIYLMENAEGVSLGKGKYLVIWKRTSNGWKMYRDMFNSDSRPNKNM